MIEFENEIELVIPFRDPLAHAEHLDESIRHYIDTNIRGHCYNAVYVKEIIAILAKSPMFIHDQGTYAVGQVNIKLRVKAILTPKFTIIADMVYKKHPNNIATITNAYCTGIINTNNSNLLRSINDSETYVPIMVQCESYPMGKSQIEISQHNIYKYMQISFLGVSMKSEDVQNKMGELRAKYIHLKSELPEHEFVIQLYERLFATATTDFTDDITDMSAVDLNKLIAGKYVTICPPMIGKSGRVLIKVGDVAPKAGRIPSYAGDIIWHDSVISMSALVEFAKTFTTNDLLVKHSALWAYYSK